MVRIVSIREVCVKQQAYNLYSEEQTREEIYTHLHTHQNGRKVYPHSHPGENLVYIRKNGYGTGRMGNLPVHQGLIYSKWLNQASEL